MYSEPMMRKQLMGFVEAQILQGGQATDESHRIFDHLMGSS